VAGTRCAKVLRFVRKIVAAPSTCQRRDKPPFAQSRQRFRPATAGIRFRREILGAIRDYFEAAAVGSLCNDGPVPTVAILKDMECQFVQYVRHQFFIGRPRYLPGPRGTIPQAPSDGASADYSRKASRWVWQHNALSKPSWPADM
jgi:hypothetical protein